MEYAKLQLACLVLVIYFAADYYRESRKSSRIRQNKLFKYLLFLSIVSLCFDALTAYTVNHLDTVSDFLNRFLHMLYLISVDTCIFVTFQYMLFVTEGLPDSKIKRILMGLPYILSVAVVVANMQSLEFRIGEVSNYSMGISAYTCFAMVVFYTVWAIIAFFRRWTYIGKGKRASIVVYLGVMIVITIYQAFVPEALLTSFAVAIIIIGIYLNLENPDIKESALYEHEMIMGFATLVEKRDNSTGGHIRRTRQYVELIAKELRRQGHYKKILTKDYIDNLRLAAPMHDIGKIAVPDAILQKPGRLTDEEFEIMKLHAQEGGRIIQETLEEVDDEDYKVMAYNVARYHHEKWNGRGYPDGLKEYEIPLEARIMAIADVFDAVSEKRCYRDALPLDECFAIIEEGRGRDFEPLLVDIFLGIREKVEEAHYKFAK
ncbi:MAG: HD domain-containing protein [Lachnospiraceae bacterium]|nr:HD domain-containing protein [Lachnospiraceae bacterium]